MKKETKLVMLLVLAVVMSINLSAQISKNIVDTTKQWSVLVRGKTTFTLSYKIGNDTIHNGKLYRKVLENKYDVSHSVDTNFIFKNKLIREDSSRVYLDLIDDLDYNKNEIGEILLYDFNLNIGDTFPFFEMRDDEERFIHIDDAQVNYIVTEIDSILIDSIYLKKITLTNSHNFIFNYNMIEGVGTNRGFITFFATTHHDSQLLCCSSNDTYLYMSPDYNSCRISCDIANDIQQNTIVYPTLAKNNVMIFSKTFPLKIMVLNNVGNKVIEKEIYNSESIDISFLPTGLYNFIIHSLNTITKQKIIKL